MRLKKGLLNVFAGIFLLNASFIMTGCSNKKEIVDISNSSLESTDKEENKVENKDEIIISYFENEEKEIDKILEDESNINDKISDKVIVLVDFLFYGGEIKGITLDEISDSTKEKALGILTKIDSKIETKVPNYKEAISDKASSALNWLKEKTHNGVVKIDDFLNKKIDNYDQIKDTASDVVEETKNDFIEVKDIISDGFSKVKDKYENWRDNRKND